MPRPTIRASDPIRTRFVIDVLSGTSAGGSTASTWRKVPVTRRLSTVAAGLRGKVPRATLRPPLLLEDEWFNGPTL